MTPKTFTGGGIPAASQPSDMGNAITHKQSARVVVTPVQLHDPTDHRSHNRDYEEQLKALAEREFCMIAKKSTHVLSPSALPGDHAGAISLAYLNHIILQQENTITQDDNTGYVAAHMKRHEYMPFGPVIQTDLSTRHKEKAKIGPSGHVNRGVTNIAIGGRVAFANCFIRTASDSSAVVNIGDAVSVATFAFAAIENHDTGTANEPQIRDIKTLHFMFVDNEYDVLKLAAQEGDQRQKQCKVLEGRITNSSIRAFIQSCTASAEEAKRLCMALRCAFRSPGTGFNVTYTPDLAAGATAGTYLPHPAPTPRIACMCTKIECMGVIIECPIPNAANENEVNVLNNMLSGHAEMSTTHPVYVQMSS